MPDEPTVRVDAALAERYEQLRAAALGGRADGWRLGLGVLSGKGVAAWLRAWTTCPSPAPVREPSAPTAASGPAPSGREGAELVQVLAAMALAHV